MFFKEVIGQQSVKERLIGMVSEQKVSHALLFSGPQGSGLLPMALAFSQYINCQNPGAQDSCGVCPACKKIAKLVHPDLHFVFPIYKKKGVTKPLCEDFLDQWREFVAVTPYFTDHEWFSYLDAENAQGKIYTEEGNEIIRKLSLKSFEGKYKIMIIWQPEKMHAFAANKLLKILEEPPLNTLFILVSHNPAGVLPTILSRTQQLKLPPLSDEVIESVMQNQFGASAEQAHSVARISAGNFIKAREAMEEGEEKQFFFNTFTKLMRITYSRNLVEMLQWVDATAGMPREQVKKLLSYTIDMLRESYISNFDLAELIYASPAEDAFIDKFKPFVTDKNVESMVTEISLALSHIEQNGHLKLVLFDMSLKLSDFFYLSR